MDERTKNAKAHYTNAMQTAMAELLMLKRDPRFHRYGNDIHYKVLGQLIEVTDCLVALEIVREQNS